MSRGSSMSPKITTIGLLVTLTAAALIAWLWTLQPQAPKSVTSEKNPASNSQAKQDQSPFEPADGNILKSTRTKLKGKIAANNFAVVYSSSFVEILKADSSGNFSLDLNLAKGLNLLTVSAVSPDLSSSTDTQLTYYVDLEDTGASLVFAGSVKTIFNTLITLTTNSGDKNIRVAKSTNITVPKIGDDKQEATAVPALKQIRIGDYAITLGVRPEDSKEKDSLAASKLTITRTDVPGNDKKLALVKTLTGIKQNTISVKTIKDSKILDLTFNKNSDIRLDGKDGKAADVVKDKSAIVIYHLEKDTNVIDIIYLLP